MSKRQVCIVGGGEAFASDADFQQWLADLEISYERLFYGTDWKPWLAEQLPDYDVLQPLMPNKQDAKYTDWATYFSKIMPFLDPSAILIGHSLGGIFLAKYLSEKRPAERFSKVILIAAPYDDEASESLGGFKLVSAMGLAGAADKIDLLYSKDDPVVPFSELAKFQADLPEARTRVFTNKGHFIGQPEFPELLEAINSK